MADLRPRFAPGHGPGLDPDIEGALGHRFHAGLTGRFAASWREVNFFAHALLAAEHNDDPAYLVGSMLPDFCTMVGVRPVATGDTLVDAGMAHHHLVDDVFHPATGFVQWMGQARDELEDAGLDIGPAMAVGHVGVELIIDGWLGTRDGGQTPYRPALIQAAGASLELGEHSLPLKALIARLVDAPFPEGYTDGDFVAERLERILRGRPRLALTSDAVDVVRSWAHRASEEAPRRVPELMSEVRRGLAARIDFREPGASVKLKSSDG